MKSGGFPNMNGLLLGDILIARWERSFPSAKHILDYGKNVFGSMETKKASGMGES